MNIDNITARELMTILDSLFDEFGAIDKGMVIGALSMYFRIHGKEQESLAEATQDDEPTQSNNSTTNSTKSLDEPVRAKRAPHKQAVTVNGITYESTKTACRRLNIKASAIYQAVYRKGMTPEKAIERYLERHREETEA